MSTWASPRDSQDGPKDGAFDVVPVMRNSWAENRENSVRSVRRPQSLLRELDLRFHPDQERKYKQGLQENLVVGGLACIGSATGAALFAVVPTFVREVAREEKAFGTTFDARAWVFLVWALNLLLMLSYILLSTIRLCRGRLQSWNWEAFFVVVVSIFLFSMAFANFWHLPFIVGEDPVGLWVHDARGSDIFMLLAIDGILTMVAMYVPVRSSVLWIPFVCAVVPFFVNTLVFQSVFTDTHMILFALLGLSGFAYHGALRREKTHRQKWTFEHMVEEAEEVMREQDNKIQETTAQVKGLRVVAEALCDVIVKLDSKKCVDGANPRQDAFFETKLEGRCFEDFLSEQDRSRFSKLMSSIQVGFPACMPVTIRKKHLTSEVHLLAVDTGITREPRYLIGMRIEAEHFTAVEEEHHETPENANSEEHHENPEKESKAKDESEKKSKESTAPNANSEEHHETPENANSEEHHENPEKESKAKEQKLSGKEADVSKGCDARRKAKQGTEEWCRCNANAELIKTRSPCEDQGGGRKNACVWSVETRSCIPRKRGKPWN